VLPQPRRLQHRLGEHVPQPGQSVDHHPAGRAAHPVRLVNRVDQRVDGGPEGGGLLDQLTGPQRGKRHRADRSVV
jgi:hypothetical protein